MKPIKILSYMLVVFSLGVSAKAQIYNWTTIAGLAPFRGSTDATNNTARFYFPQGVAVDNSSNLLVVDGDNATIRKLTRAGTNWVVSTIAGLAGSFGSADGTNLSARFGPGAGQIAVASDGNVYVADWSNDTIRRLTPEGTNWVTTTIAGLAKFRGGVDGTNSAVRFNGPNGVAVDGGGTLYVADLGDHTIRKLTPLGTNWVSSTIAGQAGSAASADGTNSAARFNGPICLTIDSRTNLFVADGNNNTIRKVTPVGTNWVTTTIAGLAGTYGSADGTNNVARFNGPYGISVDVGGNVFVVDDGNNTIRKVTPMGTNWVTTTIGGRAGAYGNRDGTNSAARFGPGTPGDGPACVAVDSLGSLYVTDYGNSTIRKGMALPVLQNVAQSNGLVTLIWSSAIGQILQLQYIADLGSTNWINLGGTISATNGTMTTSDSIVSEAQRFYRFVLLP